MNILYYGDCLDVLRNSIEDESIDLIYIDPPFNSKRDYNVLFETIDLSDAKAQKQAFADTWSNIVYLDEINQIQELNLSLYKFLSTLDDLKLPKGIVSYLTIMAHRIWYMHRKLKKTGSFYLHCDPTMSHYLKIVCDLIFSKKNFKNEIIWCYSGGGIPKKDFPRKHDVILRYSKTADYQFFPIYRPYTAGTVLRGRTKVKGKYAEKGLRIEGTPVTDWWIDIPKLTSPTDKEKLHFPTQKSEALMERIIETSSKRGYVVADFFCGCGTTIAVAQRLKRKWIGVDISHLAIRLVYDRILKPYENKPKAFRKVKENIEINGFPRDIASAKDLAEKTDKSRLKFQDWVIEIMMHGVSNPKKTADGGYDGYITFHKSEKKKHIVLIEVKSGKCGVMKLRSFITTVINEKANFGAFVCFEEFITPEMKLLAKKQGQYHPELWGNKYDKIQIISLENLLKGENIKYPLYQNITFKNASSISIIEDENENADLFE